MSLIPKILRRKTKHKTTGIKYGGVTARKMQNTECGRMIGRGQFATECTRPRGHKGSHTAYHPSIKKDIAARRRLAKYR